MCGIYTFTLTRVVLANNLQFKRSKVALTTRYSYLFDVFSLCSSVPGAPYFPPLAASSPPGSKHSPCISPEKSGIFSWPLDSICTNVERLSCLLLFYYRNAFLLIFTIFVIRFDHKDRPLQLQVASVGPFLSMKKNYYG
jgi:hypothetical protein